MYVTGWDNGSGDDSYEDCGGSNEDPPRGYDGKGAQLWGHMVDIITTDDDVIVGDGEVRPHAGRHHVQSSASSVDLMKLP